MGDARVVVGEAAAGDVLDPSATAAKLPPDAPLRNILQSSAVTTIHSQRAEASANAKAAQRSHKLWSTLALIGGAIAALSSGLLLVASDPTTTVTAAETAIRQFAESARVPILICQVTGLLLTVFSTTLVASMKFAERWNAARGKAEDGRIKLVEAVMKAGEDAIPANPQGYAEAFEYFRRYQLELQLGYQRRRLRRVEGGETVNAYLIAGLTAIAAIGGVIGAISYKWAIVGAFLGIAVPVLLSATRSWRSIDGNGGLNSTRAAKDQLEVEMAKVDDMRKSAADGDVAVVGPFVDHIHAILRVESGAWASRFDAAPAGQSATDGTK